MHAFLITDNLQVDDGLVKRIASSQMAKIIPETIQKIEDVRNLRRLVKLSFSEKTALFIQEIDNATQDAQNAFLKNLEEPQKNLIYILTAKNLNNVIATIVSRCEIVKPAKPKTKKAVVDKNVEKFLEVNLDKRFQIIEKIKEREDAINFVNELIIFQRSKKNYDNLSVYLNTLKNLKSNGNVSLQLTNMLVSS